MTMYLYYNIYTSRIKRLSATQGSYEKIGILEKIAERYQKNTEFPWINEYIDVQSDVDVWLYTRPIGGRTDRATARRHWAVVFQWQNKFATYEGMNIDGYNM